MKSRVEFDWKSLSHACVTKKYKIGFNIKTKKNQFLVCTYNFIYLCHNVLLYIMMDNWCVNNYHASLTFLAKTQHAQKEKKMQVIAH